METVRFHENIENFNWITVDPISVPYGATYGIPHRFWGFVNYFLNYCLWRRDRRKPHFRGVSPKVKKTVLN